MPSGGNGDDQGWAELADCQISFGETHEYQIASFHCR